MIWIIASVPFWIISIALLVGVAVGVTGLHQKIDHISSEDFQHTVAGLGIFLVAAGVFAIIAAKICS